jgi:tetratricopeptide (TPR) repeat protein
MSADQGHSRARQTQPDRVPQQQKPPPKPNRPRAAPAVEPTPPATEDDETTMRLLVGETAELRQAMRPAEGSQNDDLVPWPGFEATALTAPHAAKVDQNEIPTIRPPAALPDPVPVPPPLPVLSNAGAQTTPLALQVPTSQVATRFSAARAHFTKVGAAIFAAGVLVGAVVSAAVMTSSEPRTLEGTANAPAIVAPKPASLAATTAMPVERAAEHREAPEIQPENGSGRRVAEPAREPASLLVSSFTAPSCRQLLGSSVVERNAPVASQRETRLANRELVRGNVTEAQAAYCRALIWDRKNVDRHVNLGRLFLVRRDWKQAAEYGQSALALNPSDPRALGVVGDAWAALHKTDEARTAWLKVEGKPNASASDIRLVVRRNMALAQRVQRLKDFSLAERLYRRVLLFSPEHAGAAKGIASCLMKAGDHPAAEAWAHRAKALRQSKKAQG